MTSDVQAVIGKTLVVSLMGDAQMFGLFERANFGLSDGLILSTGRVVDSVLSKKPDYDFAPPGPVGDAVTLDLQWTPTDGYAVTFKYVFASLELPSYGGRNKNDAFEIDLCDKSMDGTERCVDNAKLPSGVPVTIDGLVPAFDNRSKDNAAYVNNPGQDYFSYTGYSKPLDFSGILKKGLRQSVRFLVSDNGDGNWDSAVLVACSSFKLARIQYLPAAWGQCSTTCGRGTQARGVTCVQQGLQTSATSTDESVSDDKCKSAGLEPLAVSQPCVPQNAPCPQGFSYFAGPWGACTVSCGTGTQSRSILCKDSGNVTEPNDQRCKAQGGLVNPPDTQDCFLRR
jgi:hypothetical protein